jgi:hypothetical protein
MDILANLLTLTAQIDLPLDNPLVRIVLLVLAIAVVWFVLQFLFKLALRIFVGGCLVIVIIGAILFLLRAAN